MPLSGCEWRRLLSRLRRSSRGVEEGVESLDETPSAESRLRPLAQGLLVAMLRLRVKAAGAAAGEAAEAGGAATAQESSDGEDFDCLRRASCAWLSS